MLKSLFAAIMTILVMPSIMYAEWVYETLEIDGRVREYKVYLPAGYSASGSYSLVLGLHGLWGNMNDFSNSMHDFHRIADTANIILAYPQGLDNPPPLGTGWNSSAGMLGLYPSDGIDDVGFINAVTDRMQAKYPIIKEQTYLFGFSNGGFMAQKVACEANERYAAIASIAGTLGNRIIQCNPARKVPIIHFHGTFDVNVSYFNPPMGRSVSALLGLWSTNNNCSGREIIKVPDIVNDGYYIEHFVYKNCDARVEHFKVYNAFHILLHKNANDISYAEEMWRFFSYKEDTAVPTSVHSLQSLQFNVYPNPAQDELTIELGERDFANDLTLQILDYTGRKVMDVDVSGKNKLRINCSQLPNGIYLIHASDASQIYSTKFVISR